MSNQRPYRFALLTHMPMEGPLNPEYITDEEFTLDFFKISYSTPLFGVQELLDSGYEVVLIYSSFGANVLSELGHSVVLVPKTDQDIIKALVQAREVTRHVALSVHDNENIDVAFLEGLLGIKIYPLRYNSVTQLQKNIKTAVEQGAEAVTGGGVSATMASRHNIRFIRVAPSFHSFGRAVEQAKGLAKARRGERESREQLVSVFKLFREGVICVDREGTTIFNNTVAFELLKIDSKRQNRQDFDAFYQSLMITDVLTDGVPRVENIVTIHGAQFVVTTLPISIHGLSHGAVAFINDVNAIRNISGRLRESQRQSGFFAHFHVNDFKGECPAVRRLKNMVRMYAPHDAAVLVYGETGSGKEVLAQSLHNAGPRREHPFVAVNCAALPDSLLESELFGYEEGAFTGAKKGGKPGVFEMAHKGTLFLDEVGDMGQGAQLRLLRVLETKEVIRVGGNRIIPVDIRVISASHKPLMELVRQGLFRQDLFYRLAVLRLNIPPLRQRPEDLPYLLWAPLARHGKTIKDLTPAMLEVMRCYGWPGNVRELHAFMESYLILLGGAVQDQTLFLDLLKDWSLDESPESCLESTVSPEPAGLKSCERNARLQRAREVLRECNGNKRLTARKLGVSYNTLWRILGASEDVSG